MSLGKARASLAVTRTRWRFTPVLFVRPVDPLGSRGGANERTVVGASQESAPFEVSEYSQFLGCVRPVLRLVEVPADASAPVG